MILDILIYQRSREFNREYIIHSVIQCPHRFVRLGELYQQSINASFEAAYAYTVLSSRLTRKAGEPRAGSNYRL